MQSGSCLFPLRPIVGLLVMTVALVLCASCARTHGIRPAHLAFDSIQIRKDSVYFEVRFHSDIELLELFWREKRANRFDQVFMCALAQDTDFSVTHTITYAATGLIESDPLFKGSKGFGYIANVAFKKVADKRRSSEYLDKDTLMNLLAGKSSIPCKVISTATGYKAYYTGSLYMSVADIVSQLNRAGE